MATSWCLDTVTHPSEEALASLTDPAVLAHVADCPECRAVVAAAAEGRRRPAPARINSRRRWWMTAAAVWVIAMIVGMLVPSPQPDPDLTHLRIDFADPDGYILKEGTVRTIEMGDRELKMADGSARTEGWSTVTIKLTRPIVVRRDCILRMDIATNAAFVLATLFPPGRDATFARLDLPTDQLSTLTATFRPGENFETTLKPGDRIDWVTIAAPTADETYMMVKAIEIAPGP
jgi:hypothetical protein